MMHLKIQAYDPQDLAEILDALAAHMREYGCDEEKLLVTGNITGIEATADIRWEAMPK
jgi:hypothetical protein